MGVNIGHVSYISTRVVNQMQVNGFAIPLGRLFRLLISRLAAIEIPTIVPGESLQFQRFLLGFCRPNVIGIHCIVLQV